MKWLSQNVTFVANNLFSGEYFIDFDQRYLSKNI